jgi:hypothetical protein
MTKLKERAVIRSFTLRVLRPQQIQTKLSEVYDEQAFQRLALEKGH